MPQTSTEPTNHTPWDSSEEGFITLGMRVRTNDSTLYNDQLTQELMKITLLLADWLERKAHPLDEIMSFDCALLFGVSLLHFSPFLFVNILIS